jgi:hypothetical protein
MLQYHNYFNSLEINSQALTFPIVWTSLALFCSHSMSWQDMLLYVLIKL